MSMTKSVLGIGAFNTVRIECLLRSAIAALIAMQSVEPGYSANKHGLGVLLQPLGHLTKEALSSLTSDF